METRNNRLYLGGMSAEELARKYDTPLYVYEEDVIRKRCADLAGSIGYEKLKIYYACKANSNPEILKILRKEGCSMETVSMGEVLLAFKAGFKPDQIIYTCSNIKKEELKFLISKNITINIDSVSQLEKYGKLNPNSSVSIRINQGIGAGHHKNVVTGKIHNKFGIHSSKIPEVKRIAEKHRLRIIGIHQHIGSGIMNEGVLLNAAKTLIQTSKRFKNLEFIDIGGGFGVSSRPDEKPLDMKKLGRSISNLFDAFCKEYGKKLTMIIEPGRYLVAEAGTLLVCVTDIKKRPSVTFVGVDSGFNHFARPVMYGSYHQILNASCVEGEKEAVSVVGNICESGDMFANNRMITKAREGEILAILNTGAYGFSMSSNFNSRPRPAEVLVRNGMSRVIRKRESPF